MKKQLNALEVQDVLKKLEIYLSDLKIRWDQENNVSKSWFKMPSNYILKATIFIVSTLDELITFVEPIIPEGKEKKASVIAVTSRMFDYIVIQAFPFWLKPFAGIIKTILVGIIINHLVDFIVSKYKTGYWAMKQEAKDGKKINVI